MPRRTHFERKANDQERLEEQVRRLKSENRHLHKRLKRITKGYRHYLDSEPIDEIKDPKVKKEPEKVCFECERGVLELKLILNRRFRECNVCNNRTKVKILQLDGTWKKMEK